LFGPDRRTRWGGQPGLGYRPQVALRTNEPEDAGPRLDLIFSDHFSRNEPGGVPPPLRDVLLTRGDYYMHLADMNLVSGGGTTASWHLYADPDRWTRPRAS